MTMTLDEAIQHCKEQVQEQAKRGCYSCAEEHQQLAEWLKELKAYKENTCGDAISREKVYEMLRRRFESDDAERTIWRLDEIPSITPQPCEDAISRQAVLNAMYELCDTGETLKENPWRDNPHIDAVVEAIEELPSVTPQQRTGRWIPVGYDGYADGSPVYDWWECSECGWEHSGDEESLTAFCPNCGAQMEVEE